MDCGDNKFKRVKRALYEVSVLISLTKFVMEIKTI